MEVWRRRVRGMGMRLLQQGVERGGMAGEVEGGDSDTGVEERGRKGSKRL